MLIPRVEQKLENLVSEEVLTKVVHSEWTTPILLCSKFKITINPAWNIDKLLLPIIDELFASTAGRTASIRSQFTYFKQS